MLNPDRVRVLGQLLMEALDEKYPPEPVRGHGITLAFTEDERDMHKQKYAELHADREHWKTQAEQSAQTIRELHEQVKTLERQKDDAYYERNQCVALIARLSVRLGYRVGLGRHPVEDTSWDDDWRTIVFIDLPTGQVSWHIQDSEVVLFGDLPEYRDRWDGHTAEEKYRRVNAMGERDAP